MRKDHSDYRVICRADEGALRRVPYKTFNKKARTRPSGWHVSTMHLVAQCLEDSHYAFEAAPRAIILRHSILIVLFGPIAHHRRLQGLGYHCHARRILAS